MSMAAAVDSERSFINFDGDFVPLGLALERACREYERRRAARLYPSIVVRTPDGRTANEIRHDQMRAASDAKREAAKAPREVPAEAKPKTGPAKGGPRQGGNTPNPLDPDEVVRLYTSGLNLDKVAFHFHAARARVVRILDERGIPRHAPPRVDRAPKPLDPKEVIALYAAGETVAGVARLLHVGHRRVREIIDEAGVPRHPQQRRTVQPLDPEEVRKLRDQGLSLRAIAHTLHVSQRRVTAALAPASQETVK